MPHIHIFLAVDKDLMDSMTVLILLISVSFDRLLSRQGYSVTAFKCVLPIQTFLGD